MRHNKAGRKFSRTPAHRKALFRNMAKSLLTHYSIRTTEAKAKDLRGVVEPLITLAKRNDLHARREAFKVLGNHQLVKALFDEIGPLYAGVPGGYTRVIKLGSTRRGDNAPLAVIELTRKPGQEDEAKAPKSKAETDEAVKQAVAAAEAAVKTAEADTAEKAEPEPPAEEKKND